MFKFFKKKEEPKEEVKNVNEKELTEEELEKVNNYGSDEYKKTLAKDPDELTEEELDKMSYDYYHGDEEAYIKK